MVGLSGFRYFAARLGVPRLRARPKGAALWNPAAFEKAGETFIALRALLFCSCFLFLLFRTAAAPAWFMARLQETWNALRFSCSALPSLQPG